MTIFPWKHFEIESNLTKEQINAQLIAHVTVVAQFSDWSYFEPDDNKLFQGVLSNDTFKICRKIDKRRDSFRAIVSGKIATKNNKSRIKVFIRLKWFVYVFMLIYLIPLTIICLILPFKLPWNEFECKPQYFMILIPYIMIVFSLILFNVPFHNDAEKTMEFLKNTLR